MVLITRNPHTLLIPKGPRNVDGAVETLIGVELLHGSIHWNGVNPFSVPVNGVHRVTATVWSSSNNPVSVYA